MTDTEIVKEIREGRRSAESVLYDRYAARVYYLALRNLGVREDAEDVRGETFLRVLRAIRGGRLEVPAALPGFILETARNVLRERVRTGSRVIYGDADAIARLPGAAVDSVPADPFSIRAIEETLDGMRPREKAFLRMYYYEELSKEEISRRLGIKEERMRLIKSRALRRFREAYLRLTARAIHPEPEDH